MLPWLLNNIFSANKARFSTLIDIIVKETTKKDLPRANTQSNCGNAIASFYSLERLDADVNFLSKILHE